MSEDGGKTWTEQGDIRLTDSDDYHGWAENNIVELSDGRIAMIIRADRLGGWLNYPDGFVSADKKRLHFALDDNRHRAVYVEARLPTKPE